MGICTHIVSFSDKFLLDLLSLHVLLSHNLGRLSLGQGEAKRVRIEKETYNFRLCSFIFMILPMSYTLYLVNPFLPEMSWL